jgi:hypothetical protein
MYNTSQPMKHNFPSPFLIYLHFLKKFLPKPIYYKLTYIARLKMEMRIMYILNIYQFNILC